MNKIVNAVKKAVATKKVVTKSLVAVEKEVTESVCTNCENSGKECRACGFGTAPVV